MSRKTLNAKNLETLGAERLAALVMELVEGDAARKRRARMALSAAAGPEEIAADIRKRMAQMRRATGYVNWRRRKALVTELTGLLDAIAGTVAPSDPAAAFELLWSFQQLAPSIHERTDDGTGAVGDVFRAGIAQIEALAPRLAPDPKRLAARIFDAARDAGYGEFDGVITALQEALGPEGLAHLKTLITAWEATPPSAAEIAAFRAWSLGDPETRARKARSRAASVLLAEIADAQGDVDAWIARFTPEQRTYGIVAPQIARRLLDADRLSEAAAIIETAMAHAEDRVFPELDAVHDECLARQGRTDELKARLKARFEARLDPADLRALLKFLPDFEDFEAEEAALDHAEAHPDTARALAFLTAWPALPRAARLVLARAEALDGDAWHLLTPAAEALEATQPLAATLLLRAMILDTLGRGKSSRYGHAARHLAECGGSAAMIADWQGHPGHEAFAEALRRDHRRKSSFWERVDGD